MTIEQEFFEAFGIKKNRFYCPGYKSNYKGGVCVTYPHCKSNEDICKHYSENGHYLPITPEIVLKLEELILKIVNLFSLELMYHDNEKYSYTAMVEACGGNWRLHCSGNTRENALLDLCIQLKDEIQDQVKGLFNE